MYDFLNYIDYIITIQVFGIFIILFNPWSCDFSYIHLCMFSIITLKVIDRYIYPIFNWITLNNIYWILCRILEWLLNYCCQNLQTY